MASLRYQGERKGFHYLRLHHGGLDFSTDYRLSSANTRSEIQLPYSRDSERWIPCHLRESDNGSGFVIDAVENPMRFAPMFPQH